MPFNFPILLTWLRMAVIPLVVGVFYVPDTRMALPAKNLMAAVPFIVTSLTDQSDGFLARRRNQTSAFGASLDPIADKLMVAAALPMLLPSSRVSDVITLVIIGREVIISALRGQVAQVGALRSMTVNFLGKLKTTLQMTAIPLLLSGGRLFSMIDTQMQGTWLIYAAAVLTLWPMAYYTKFAWPQIYERAK